MSDDQKHDPLAEFEELDLDAELDVFLEESDEDTPSSSSDMDALSLAEIEEKKEKAQHSPGVLVFRNKRYAVGLTWLTVDEDAGPKLVKERAKKLGADYHCLRNTIVSQHGFGYLEKGHKLGMSAAGALAADALIGEWHGVFIAENGWWYLAVHSDTIEPDGDIFFETEEAAYNYFLEMNESHSWPRAYAPESWNLPKTNGEVPLEKLFDDMPSVPLKPANVNAIFGGKRNKELALVLGGLFVGIIVFAIIAQQTIPSLIPDTKKAPGPLANANVSLSIPPKLAAEQATKENAVGSSTPLPQPSLFMEACLASFSELTVSFPGWQLKTLRCRNNLSEAVWNKKTAGSLDSLRSNLQKFPAGVTQSYSGSNTFLATTVMKNIQNIMVNTTLPEREIALILLNDRFSKISRLSVKDVIPKRQAMKKTLSSRNNRRNRLSNTINNEPKKEELRLTLGELPYLELKIEMDSPPNLILNYFNIPGLIFDMIEWNVSGQKWTYNARIILKYENRQNNIANATGR